MRSPQTLAKKKVTYSHGASTLLRDQPLTVTVRGAIANTKPSSSRFCLFVQSLQKLTKDLRHCHFTLLSLALQPLQFLIVQSDSNKVFSSHRNTINVFRLSYIYDIIVQVLPRSIICTVLGAIPPVVTRRYALNYNPNGSVADRSRAGFVYLIHCVGTTRYKIGRSTNPRRRLETLQSQGPFPLELIGFFQTDDCVAQEARLHKLAALHRINGEWFDLPDFWIKRVNEWFYNQKATFLAQGKICRVEKMPGSCLIEPHKKIVESREKFFKLQPKLGELDIPNLPPKIPVSKKNFDVAISLLGSRQSGYEFAHPTRQKIISLLGVYPSPEEAAVWKKTLKSVGFMHEPKQKKSKEQL